jgi:hypothetical protein
MVKNYFDFEQDLEWIKDLATNVNRRHQVYQVLEKYLKTEDKELADNMGDVSFAVLI